MSTKEAITAKRKLRSFTQLSLALQASIQRLSVCQQLCLYHSEATSMHVKRPSFAALDFMPQDAVPHSTRSRTHPVLDTFRSSRPNHVVCNTLTCRGSG
jgi:hypothetical protein